MFVATLVSERQSGTVLGVYVWHLTNSELSSSL